MWFSKLGVPKQIIRDLGGEFTNETWSEMLELLNIKEKTTAAFNHSATELSKNINAMLEETMTNVNADIEMNELRNQAVFLCSHGEEPIAEQERLLTISNRIWEQCMERDHRERLGLLKGQSC